jgi:hypothetical protein
VLTAAIGAILALSAAIVAGTFLRRRDDGDEPRTREEREVEPPKRQRRQTARPVTRTVDAA